MPLHKALKLTASTPIVNGVCLAQRPQSGTTQQQLNINGVLAIGGVATLDSVMRGVTISSTANDSLRTFTVKGYDYNGQIQQDTIVGPNTATNHSTMFFSKVTSVSVDGDCNGMITVGTDDTAATHWFLMDYNGYPVASLIVNVMPNSSLNYTVEYTGDNMQNGEATTATAMPQPHNVLVNLTQSDSGNFIASPVAVRLKFNSWTSGSATLNIIQGSSQVA